MNASLRNALNTSAATLRRLVSTVVELPLFSLFARALAHPVTNAIAYYVDTDGNLCNAAGTVLVPGNTVTATTPLTGATITAPTDGANQFHYITPAGTIAALTFTFPSNADSRIGQRIVLVSTQQVTALTLSASGLTLNGDTPVGLEPHVGIGYTKVAASVWQRDDSRSEQDNLNFTKEAAHIIQVSTSTTADTVGGALTVRGGAGFGSGNGGAMSVAGGAGGATGTGGAGSVTGGAGGATSGAGGVGSVVGGAGTAGNSAGGIGKTVGGAGQGTGAGGKGQLIGGASGAGATGNGGAAEVTGGAAASTNGNGGSVVITGGAKTGTGIDGVIIERSVKLVKQGAQTAKTVSATLTAAEVLAGIITVNQAAAASSAQQLPTAADLDTALPDAAANDAFDFSVINTSTVDAEDASLTTNTGWTLVGSMEVHARSAEGSLNSSGRFRARKTGSAAWTLYRLS